MQVLAINTIWRVPLRGGRPVCLAQGQTSSGWAAIASKRSTAAAAASRARKALHEVDQADGGIGVTCWLAVFGSCSCMQIHGRAAGP